MREQVDAVCANLRSDKISARKVCRAEVPPSMSSSTMALDMTDSSRAAASASNRHSPTPRPTWATHLTHMQEGFKLLNQLLDSPAFHAYLDARTAKLRPHDKLPSGCLCHAHGVAGVNTALVC